MHAKGNSRRDCCRGLIEIGESRKLILMENGDKEKRRNSRLLVFALKRHCQSTMAEQAQYGQCHNGEADYNQYSN